jgi:Antirestriction protein (ArdA).
MPYLHAQPYDLSATGFYFESMEDYRDQAKANRNAYGAPVEEYEIQFIDGDDLDCALADAWGISQANIGGYFKAADAWNDHEKIVFIIAVGECGYNFDPETVSPNDYDVDLYHLDSLKELAEQFVEEGLFGDIPDTLAPYLDYDAIARDLACDYAESVIAGDRLIYRAA